MRTALASRMHSAMPLHDASRPIAWHETVAYTAEPVKGSQSRETHSRCLQRARPMPMHEASEQVDCGNDSWLLNQPEAVSAVGRTALASRMYSAMPTHVWGPQPNVSSVGFSSSNLQRHGSQA